MVSSKASGLAIVAIVLLAFGLAGTQAIGLHKQCTDGIDNDNDFDPLYPPEYGADAYDSNCAEYPFADGNGESPTPANERFNSVGVAYQISGYDTGFDWLKTQYQQNPHPFVMPGAPPLYCPFGGTLNADFNTQAAFNGFDSWPLIEGTLDAYADHWATCPLT